ncbi:MAG: tripartite tricarboxylate transporter substrate binding protein [Betaproteobacteria bacterium]|nr:tripartite tricarboxylate transporter substrate binding protein [Betaproteobacteria bacterium]
MNVICRALGVGIVLAVLVTALHVDAQTAPYPSKPVRIIVPYPPGGASDITARVVADKLTQMWKQSVIVDNRPGATGILGTDLVAKAAPDGYTLGLVASSQAINAVVNTKLPYDTLKDFSYITETASVPLVLVAASGFPATTATELIALAKKEPGRISYASSGPGGAPHLAAELFKSSTGTDMLHVPYKGSTQAHPDLLSGQVGIMFDTIVAVMPHLKSGRLKALATTGKTRSTLLPDVAAVAETVPGYEASSWGGIIGPAGIPEEVVRKINADIVATLKTPEVKERLAQLGADVVANSPAEFAQVIRLEIDKWGKVVRAAGVKAE